MDKITEIEEHVLGKYRNSIPRVAFCGAMKKLREAEQEYDTTGDILPFIRSQTPGMRSCDC